MDLTSWKWGFLSFLCLAALFASQPVLGQKHGQSTKAGLAAPRRVVIPFDFESRFDGGHYGQRIGELVWSKLRDMDHFILPESMQDVREACQRANEAPGIDTPLETVARIAHTEHGGDIAIWGKVERVAGMETDAYDLWIRIADVSAEPPRVLYAKQVRTVTVSEIPHTYLRDALAELAGADAKRVIVSGQTLQQKTTIGPRLLSCDFERGTSAPEGWSPLGANVSWRNDESSRNSNRFLRFSLPDDVAGTTGVLSYSKEFAVETGATYRLQCRWRSSGPALKVFVKCYGDVSEADESSSGSGSPQTRELYRSQQNLRGAIGVWNFHTEEFTPRHTLFALRRGRVMLYAYWPAGTADWDDVEVVQVAAPRLPAGGKVSKPSSKRSGQSHGSK